MANAAEQQRQRTLRNQLEAERLDRSRNPSTYPGN